MYGPFCAGCDCEVFADCVHMLVVIAGTCPGLYVCVCGCCVSDYNWFWFSSVSIQQ